MNQAFRSFGALAATIAAALLAACVVPDGRSEAAVPRFRVDTAWPLPLTWPRIQPFGSGAGQAVSTIKRGAAASRRVSGATQAASSAAARLAVAIAPNERNA